MVKVRSVLTLTLALLAGLSAAPETALAAPVVVSERNGELVVDILARPDDPSALPKVRFYVAVPPSGVVEARRLGGEYVSRELRPDEEALFQPTEDTGKAPLPDGLFPPDPLVVSDGFTFRKTRIVAIDCYLRQLDSHAGKARDWTGYRVTVRYPASATTRTRDAADPMLTGLVLNRDYFPEPALQPSRSADRGAAQGGLDPHFSRSPNWVRIQIDRRGMYVVTYDNLRALGVNMGAIDPATLRLFSGSGIEQKRDFNDPDASWRVGNWMKESAIYVDVENPLTFGSNDRIVFYALGAEDWMDYFDPSQPDTVYHVHERAQSNYYYLTWNGDFPGQPLRMQEVASSPAGGADRTTYRERYYREKNRVSDYHYGGDFWLWEKINKASETGYTIKLDELNAIDLVTAVAQEFRTVALAPYGTAADDLPYNSGHHAVYIARTSVYDQHVIGEYRWDAAYNDRLYEDGRPVKFSGSFLGEGKNDILLKLPRDENPKDWMYFAWYSVAFERRLRALGGRVGFSSPDTTGSVNFRVTALATGEVHVFDVTDRFNVRRLTGMEVQGAGGAQTVRFASSHGGGRKHFWAASDSGLMPVFDMVVLNARDLRDVSAFSAPHMVIVTDPLPSFQSAAARLAAHRTNDLPHYGGGNARVQVVTTREIYDNFSGGQVDPYAIRNYFKFLYDNFSNNGNPVLTFALLLGDASKDHKNFTSPTPDRIPTIMTQSIYWWEEWFASDELYSHLDPGDQVPGYGVADIAVGRLPASTSEEAAWLVDKVIGYEAFAPQGVWRNQVVLVADDEGSTCEQEFTYQSERIDQIYLPEFTDVEKVYLTAYPSVSGLKPASRSRLLELWNAGAAAINYIGHGSSLQMADEIVFVDDDVSKLNNGFMLPVVGAFSCTVGDFAHPPRKSLSEQLILREEGGAIGTITASTLSDRYANAKLAYATFDNMFPKRPGEGVALGEALAAGKFGAMLLACADTVLCGSRHQESTNWRYSLMGDPAMRIAVPEQEIRLIPGQRDTLVAGIRKTIRGAVMAGETVDTGFNGRVEVRVHEPDHKRSNPDPRCFFIYYLRGGTMYRGTADVVDGEFEISFRVPRFAKPGPGVFITTYADNGARDAVMSSDTTFGLMLPSAADSTLLVPLDGPPRVRLGFKSGLTTVKPGESLQAVIRDRDGINILSTTTEGKHVLLIDDSPVPLDVTRFFSFDHGGTDTSGVLTYPLPDMSVGEHRAIFRVSDNFAQTRLDTLFFSVTDPMDYFARVAYNYPNPFSTTTQFLIELSDRASIRLDIFTISGKRIRRIEEIRDGGQEWIFWDGRDAAGDEIANGTYLYVTTVDFQGVDRPPLVLRGKLTKIQ